MLTSVWLLASHNQLSVNNLRLIISVLTTLHFPPGAAWSPMLMSCDIPNIPRSLSNIPSRHNTGSADAGSVREKIGNYTVISLLLWRNFLLSISVRACVIESGMILRGEITTQTMVHSDCSHTLTVIMLMCKLRRVPVTLSVTLSRDVTNCY